MHASKIITLLVQEGTRNDLHMAPVQTLRPWSPPAPAWLFPLSHLPLPLPKNEGRKGAGGECGGCVLGSSTVGIPFSTSSSAHTPCTAPQMAAGDAGGGSPCGEGPACPPHHTSLQSTQPQREASFILHLPLLPSAAPPGKLRVGIVGLPPHAPGNV